jgi:hypothetical protein
MPDEKKDNGEKCDYLHPENCDQESQEKKDLSATEKEVEEEAMKALDKHVVSK